MAESNTNQVFKNLKKHNGEAVAKVIRDNQLLDIPNIEHILEFAGKDPEDIKRLVPVLRSQYKIISVSRYKSDLNPLELLSRAGYEAFVVDSLKKQNSIKKYFRIGEELCTFNDDERFKDFYMIHAVKRGADKIKPADKPKREDEYGTSVISIQIPKTGGSISIKNRYNHTVNSPDSTFYNNPDNIIAGLTDSLQKFFDVEFNVSEADLPDNYRLIEDQLIKYNYEITNIYFGSYYYFTGDKIVKINTGYQVMMDYMVLDEKEKKITSPIHGDTYDVFCEAFNGKKTTRTNEKDKIIVSTADGNRVVIVDGKIVELELANVTEIGNYFLCDNTSLVSVSLPNVKKIGKNFLYDNKILKTINLPNVKEIGNVFLSSNETLKTINLPKVRSIGNCFLFNNHLLASINLPEVFLIGDSFLSKCWTLNFINLPKVKEIGNNFLMQNELLNSVNLPKVERIGDYFLFSNKALKKISLPDVKYIFEYFLHYNNSLNFMNLPKVKEIVQYGFLEYNDSLTTVIMPEKFEKLKEELLARTPKVKKIKGAIKQVIKKMVGQTQTSRRTLER